MPFDVTFTKLLRGVASEAALPEPIRALMTGKPDGVETSFRAGFGPFPGDFLLRVRPWALAELPRLRGVLKRTWPDVMEGVGQSWTQAEQLASTLRRNLCDDAKGWVQDDPPLTEAEDCPTCGRHTWSRPPRAEARFREAGDAAWGMALAHPRDGLASPAGIVTLARTPLWEAMGEEGLRGGLVARPVRVGKALRDDVVALVAPGRLGPRAAPYGVTTGCGTCGYREPRFALLPSWERPAGDERWWGGLPDTGNSLLADAPTWDAVAALSDRLFGDEPGYHPMTFYPAGWYEPGAANLFLPEHLQGEAP